MRSEGGLGDGDAVLALERLDSTAASTTACFLPLTPSQPLTKAAVSAVGVPAFASASALSALVASRFRCSAWVDLERPRARCHAPVRNQGGFPSNLGGFSLNTRIYVYLSVFS